MSKGTSGATAAPCLGSRSKEKLLGAAAAWGWHGTGRHGEIPLTPSCPRLLPIPSFIFNFLRPGPLLPRLLRLAGSRRVAARARRGHSPSRCAGADIFSKIFCRLFRGIWEDSERRAGRQAAGCFSRDGNGFVLGLEVLRGLKGHPGVARSFSSPLKAPRCSHRCPPPAWWLSGGCLSRPQVMLSLDPLKTQLIQPQGARGGGDLVAGGLCWISPCPGKASSPSCVCPGFQLCRRRDGGKNLPAQPWRSNRADVT